MQNQGGPSNPKIRVASSVPGLTSKLKIDLSGSIETVYWYIRFNIPLDESSVNGKSMEVTDTEGYIMRTDINYQTNANRIVISPLDSYEEQRYYLLKISRKVRSAKGQNLKTVISIIFKLYQGQISEYKILRQDVPVPPSRPRPSNYDEMQKNRQHNYLDNYVDNSAKRMTMSPDRMGVNVWVGIIGMVLAFVGFAVSNNITMAAGAIVCAAGMGHLAIQWRNNEFRAKVYYNRGVRYFNRMQYQSAKQAFEKALEANPENELARYGLVRVGLYK